MWRMTLTVLASTWLFAAPMLWAHRPAQAALSMLAGLVGLALAPLLSAPSRLREAVVVTGAALVLAVFIFPDGLPTVLNNVVVAMTLVIAGLLPETRRTLVHARVKAGPRAAA
jgi:hypothetical protein